VKLAGRLNKYNYVLLNNKDLGVSTSGLNKLKGHYSSQNTRRSMLGTGSKDLIHNLPKIKVPKTSD